MGSLKSEGLIQQGRQPLSNNGRPALSSLCEYLDTDLLPAFVVDLPSAILHHANPALKAQTTVQAQIADCLSAINSHGQSGPSCQTLFEWIWNVRTECLPSDTSARTPLEFCGFGWTATLLGKQWVVVVGVEPIRPETSDHDVCDTVTRENMTECSSTAKDDAQVSYKLGHIHPSGQLGSSEYLNWLRNFDWSGTSLGPMHTWSLQLRQAFEMMLVSPQPAAVVWGEDYTVVFNEAYLPIYGEKYREIMGRPFRDNWPPDVFAEFERLFIDTTITGQAIIMDNQIRYFPCEDHREERYYNMTMTPILTTGASVAGFYSLITDITKQTVFEKRMQILIDVNDSLASSRSLQDVWQSIVSVLGTRKSDVEFAAIYARSAASVYPSTALQVTLEAATGVHDDRLQLVFDEATATRTALGIAVERALNTGSTEVLSIQDGTLSEQQLARLTECGVEETCRNIVVYPLKIDEDEIVETVVVIGTCPLRVFDDDYQIFLRLLRKQCESAITVVKLIEKERTLLQERAVADSEKRFMQFAEKAPVGIYMFDSEGTYKFCNKAYEEICGMTCEELAEPMAWTTIIHSDSLDETQAYWNRLANGEGPLTFETQLKKPWRPADNSAESLDRTWCLASAFPDLSDNGELRGILGFLVDITYVKWAEGIQSRRLSEALELKRQQENFLDMTSHEIRNPLNAMSYCASELAEQLSAQLDASSVSGTRMALDDCLNMANTIVHCAKHQKRIIDDVLTLSKMDSRLLRIHPIPTNPTELVTTILDLFTSELRASGIDTSIEVLQGYRELDVVEVLIDSHRVSQIIINLLSNAIKFVQNEPHRRLRLSIDASYTEPVQSTPDVQYAPSDTLPQDPTDAAEWGVGEILFLTFSVQDTGPGMTDEQAGLLFKKFSQASPRTHINFGGSGLGLFISRELTEMHGGRIGLSSQPGSGSTFNFYIKCRRMRQEQTPLPAKSVEISLPFRLPTPVEEVPLAAKADAQPPRSNPSEIDSSPDQKRRVLIVEDNIINQRLLKRLMLKDGYEATIANHGEEALAIIQSSAWCIGTHSPRLDIVLCDIEMPVMDGKTCVRRIRQLQHEGVLHPNIPVVAVTGNARTEQIRSAKDSGFDTVICKPYEARELLALVGKMLESAYDSNPKDGE